MVLRRMVLRIKDLGGKFSNKLWAVKRIARKRVKQLRTETTVKLYNILGNIHLALITVAGLVIVTRVPILFGPLVFTKSTSLLFLLAYVVCDLIRITFLYGNTISLSFPLILLTLVTDSPVAASFVAVLGSLFSEGLYSRFVSKQRLPLTFALRRAFFYAGHHAVASMVALFVYCIIHRFTASRLLETLHLQAIAAYVVFYALCSMLLIWPHDYRVHRVLTPDEDRFVRVNLITPLLFIPPTAVVLYLYNLNVGRTANVLVIVGIFPPLFLLLFYLARKFAQTEDARMRLAVKEFARDQLGSPANMTEMVQKMFRVAGNLITYHWGAIYELKDENLTLLATKRGREKIQVWNAEVMDKSTSLEKISLPEEGEAEWPGIIKLGEGYLGKMARVLRAQPCFTSEGGSLSQSSDPYLPRKTALIPLPITVWESMEDIQERPRLVGLVALARSNRMFTIVDKERGQLLSSQMGNILLSVQRLEEALQQLCQRVEAYTQEPEKVRLAMQELMAMQVDVAQILSVIAERSFRGNWQTVLKGVVEERKESELSLPREALEEIYRHVRDGTPGMPPLSDDILRLLQTVTSSISLAFSLPYQWPDMQIGTELKELYRLLLDALEANTVSRILALDSRITAKIREFEEKLSKMQAILPTAAIDATRSLQHVIRELENFQGTQDLAEQRSVLSRALDEVVEQEREVRKSVRDPERLIFLQVLSSWRATITNALEELAREPAQLLISLRSTNALPLDEIAVALVLKNEGPGVAYRVVARLQPMPDYKVIAGEADLGSLPAGRTKELEFALRPKGKSPLRLQFIVTYNDTQRKVKVEEFADLFYLCESLAPFTEVPNPYTPGLPLKPGNPTFVGREDVFRFIRQNVATLVRKAILVLIGERRTGKTSVLQQLPARLNDPRYISVYIDGNGLGIDPGLRNFFLSFAEAIADGLKLAGISIPRLTLEELGESPQYIFEHRFLPQVKERTGERTLLLAIDEFEELGVRVRNGALPSSVFSALRHLMQHCEQLAFIFAGTQKIEDMIGDYWSVFFNAAKYRRIGFLETDAAVHLITEPVQPYGMRYDDLAVQEMLRLTAGHPYFTQLLCNILVNQCNDENRNYVTLHNVRRALDELLEAGQAHLAYIWQTADQRIRLCLAVLAELRSAMDRITASSIANRLTDFQVALDTGPITQTMNTLRLREIIVESSGSPVTYDFTAQLYAHWLRRYKPLSRVVEEIGHVQKEQ